MLALLCLLYNSLKKPFVLMRPADFLFFLLSQSICHNRPNGCFIIHSLFQQLGDLSCFVSSLKVLSLNTANWWQSLKVVLNMGSNWNLCLRQPPLWSRVWMRGREPCRAVLSVQSCASGSPWCLGCWSVCASPAWCLDSPRWCLCWRETVTSVSCATLTRTSTAVCRWQVSLYRTLS